MRKIPLATIALATMAIPVAAPASAEPVMAADEVVNGMYTVHFGDGSMQDLTFKATSCGIGCTQVAFSNASGQAQFYADHWHLALPPNPAAWRCNDGTTHRGFEEWNWDPIAGTGTMVVVRTEAACGYSDHSSQPIAHRFTLTKTSSQSGEPSVLPPAIA